MVIITAECYIQVWKINMGEGKGLAFWDYKHFQKLIGFIIIMKGDIIMS